MSVSCGTIRISPILSSEQHKCARSTCDRTPRTCQKNHRHVGQPCEVRRSCACGCCAPSRERQVMTRITETKRGRHSDRFLASSKTLFKINDMFGWVSKQKKTAPAHNKKKSMTCLWGVGSNPTADMATPTVKGVGRLQCRGLARGCWWSVRGGGE